MSKLTSKCILNVKSILEVFGGKWVLLVIGEIMTGKHRFNEIVESLGITPRKLSEVLKHLENEGVVNRIVKEETPVLIEYHLTKKGLDFEEVIIAIRSWGEVWVKEEEEL